MIKYPKIETLFERGDDKKVINRLRVTDFNNVKRIIMLEKIDGVNAQIVFSINYENLKVNIRFCSRETEIKEKDVCCIAKTCCAKLKLDKIAEWYYNTYALDQKTAVVKEVAPEVRLFGEVYGNGVRGGIIYSKEKDFRLFDIQVGENFMNYEQVLMIANELEIKAPQMIFDGCDDMLTYNTNLETVESTSIVLTYDNLKRFLENFNTRITDEGGTGGLAEGLVIRSEPLMLNRFGERIITKIKRSDFTYEEKKYTIEETNPEDQGREFKENDA